MFSYETSLNNLPLEIRYKILSYIHDLDIIGRAFGSRFTEEYTKEKLSFLDTEKISYSVKKGLSCQFSPAKPSQRDDWIEFMDIIIDNKKTEEYFMWAKKLYEQTTDFKYMFEYNKLDIKSLFDGYDDSHDNISRNMADMKYSKHGTLLTIMMNDLDIKVLVKINKYYNIPSIIDLLMITDTDCDSDFVKKLSSVKWMFECFPKEKTKDFMIKCCESIIESIHGMICYCKGGYGWPCSGSNNEIIKYLNGKMVEYNLDPYIPWYFAATDELIINFHGPQ